MKKLFLLAVLLVSMVSCDYSESLSNETKPTENEKRKSQRTGDSLQIQTYEAFTQTIDTQDPKDITPPRR